MPDSNRIQLPGPFAISTLGCAERSIAEIADLLCAFGLSRVELRAVNERLDLPAYFEEAYGEPEALKRELDASGAQVVVLDTSLSLFDHKPESREAFLEFVRWAEALGTPWLRVFDGGKYGQTEPETYLEAAAGQIAWWREARAANGWKTDILVETHDFCCSSENCLRLQAALPEPVALLWDTWHIWFKSQEPIAETWKALRPYVMHIHFKDGLREPILQFPYQYKIPGDGLFPLQELFAMLQSDSYDGAICLEWERKWHPYLPPIEAALKGLSQVLGSTP